MVVKMSVWKNVVKNFQMLEQYWGCLDKMSKVNFSPAETLCLDLSVKQLASQILDHLPFCRIIKNDDEQLEEHNSVHKVRLNQQQPSHVSLDECLKLFTKEERVSVFFHNHTLLAILQTP